MAHTSTLNASQFFDAQKTLLLELVKEEARLKVNFLKEVGQQASRNLEEKERSIKFNAPVHRLKENIEAIETLQKAIWSYLDNYIDDSLFDLDDLQETLDGRFKDAFEDISRK